MLLLASIGTATANPFADAEAAYTKGNYPEAVRIWKSLALKGDARAQSILGWMYAEGNGVSRNYPEAMKWYHLATEQGHAFAQYNLGLM